MAVSTCADLIAFALRAANVNGVGQNPIAEDANDGMVILASLLAQWQSERFMVPDLLDVSFVSTGAQSYTVGPSSNFSVARPSRIDSAFARLLPSSGGQTFDYPIGIIETREEYSLIGLKALSAVPYAVFYDSAYPVGRAYFWPVPMSGTYELHIAVKNSLPVYVNLTDKIALPPVYTQALIYGMAVQLAMLYGQEPRPSIVNAYRVALEVVRGSNQQIANLQIPAALSGRRGWPSTGQLIGGMW